ncbi:Formamidopyrimidine-DNA glycosylase [bacterium HR40]|nr:Formamidopyrimidine-DNA glycosylase [bacterium HR40]
MPELPDVELFRRIFEEHGLGRQVATVEVLDPRILEDIDAEALSAALAGDLFQAAHRHGKHLFVARRRGGYLHMHFGLTGALTWYEGEMPPWTRVAFGFCAPPHLAYVNLRLLGRVGLVEDMRTYLAAHDIGPDALDPRLDEDSFATALGHGRRPIKAALLDQSVVAGIGNVYADEILFQAGLRPDVPVSALDRGWRRRLFRAMRTVLETAVRRGAASEHFTERLPEGYLTRVRGGDGHCPRCGTPLARFRTGGRTGYFCGRCQIDPRRAGRDDA